MSHMTRQTFDKNVKAGNIQVIATFENFAWANMPIYTPDETIWETKLIRIWETWDALLHSQFGG